MRQKSVMTSCVRLTLVLILLSTVGCKSSQATPTAASKSLGDLYTSPALDTAYAGALNAYRQLMLGTTRLEGTPNAVTPEQAKALLVLWQSLQGRALQSDAEREAVLAYIETQMTPAQLQAIAALRLTQDDLRAPMLDNSQGPGGGFGRSNPGRPEAAGTLPTLGGSTLPPAMGTPQAPFGRATPQASGVARGTSSGVITGAAQDTVWLNFLIRLLSQRAAEGAASPMSSRTPNRTPTPKSPPSPTPTTP